MACTGIGITGDHEQSLRMHLLLSGDCIYSHCRVTPIPPVRTFAKRAPQIPFGIDSIRIRDECLRQEPIKLRLVSSSSTKSGIPSVRSTISAMTSLERTLLPATRSTSAAPCAAQGG